MKFWHKPLSGLLGVISLLTLAAAPVLAAPVRFEISFPGQASTGPVTGRVFVALAKSDAVEPRMIMGDYRQGMPFFGRDVASIQPDQTMVIDGSSDAYPLRSLDELPAGEYYAQALLNVYTKFDRADGKVIWAHLDQGEGQNLSTSPGNLYSNVQKIHVQRPTGAADTQVIKLTLANVIPPIQPPADTKWVKRIRIQSKLLSQWWGRPMYLGASIVLPKGYDENSKVRYPVLYFQGHFPHDASFLFSEKEVQESKEWRELRLSRGRVETTHEFYKQWISDDFPRMFLVTWEHPTPFYDASYAVNSANNGPYGDAILQELMPYIETKFRIIREPYARVLTGGSTGGWQSLALQVYHPDVFGGAWVFNPDFVDFRQFFISNLYEDKNVFLAPKGPRAYLGLESLLPERPMFRDPVTDQVLVTMRQNSQMEATLGTHGRSGTNIDNYAAVFGPVGEDGYPRPLWDHRTGVIDREAVNYAREHGYDLLEYLKRNWPAIGAKLQGKLNIYCPDMDEYYPCNAIYALEEFLTTASPPFEGTFSYARRRKHGWHPMSNAEMFHGMAEHIRRNSPEPTRQPQWIYP